MEEKKRQYQEIVKQLTAYLRKRESEPIGGEAELWKKIEKKIADKKNNFPKRKRRLYFISTAAAAILFLFYLSADHFLLKDSGALDNYVKLLEEPEWDSSQIQVYLSPEKKMNVEENKATVTYSTKGKVSINEKVQEQPVAEKNADQEYNQIVVPKGKYTHLTLSDGSTVHINSGTRVVYPRVFSSDHREIYVEGEVCLHVTKNEKAPFVVKTTSFEVEVLGTTFNVSAYKDEPDGTVVLVEGSVQLSDHNKNNIKIKPNQMVSVNEGKVDSVKEVEASDYTAWTEGLMILSLEPLAETFRKLERFYGVTIQISPDAAQLKMRGKIDLKQPFDDVLTLITKTAPVTSQKKENGVYYVLKKE